jgi:hypothetical protein
MDSNISELPDEADEYGGDQSIVMVSCGKKSEFGDQCATDAAEKTAKEPSTLFLGLTSG